MEQLISPFPSFEALFLFLLDFLHPARFGIVERRERRRRIEFGLPLSFLILQSFVIVINMMTL